MTGDQSDGTHYRFAAELWKASAEGPWIFVTLPEETADAIVDLVPRRPGFGSVRVSARIGSTTWHTSIFPDSKLRSYVLPVKKAVRVAEHLSIGDMAEVELDVELPN